MSPRDVETASLKPPPFVQEDVNLFPRTSMRVGGHACFFAEPESIESASDVITWARRAEIPVVTLGAGTNVVFGDEGYPGLVLSTRELRGMRIDGARVRVVAGECLAEVAWRASRLGLSELEWACGIPGTIGGAVVMNAGTRGGDMADVLISVEVLSDDRSVTEFPAASLRLGYRTSALLTGDLRGVVVGATLALRRDDPARCLERARGTIEERLGRLPVGASAGCIFRNPETGPTAGKLLDRAGCKGLKIGRARVSEVHANIIVNEGTNNASDVLALIDRMKHRVLDGFGIDLREEVVIYP
jgi:UDP-N-acetylmuramate dehydrogenase